MRWHTAGRRQRRKEFKTKRRCALHIRMGRCPILWHWNDPIEVREFGQPFRGYRYYGRG